MSLAREAISGPGDQTKSPLIIDLLVHDRNWQVTHQGWKPGEQLAEEVVFPVTHHHPFEASREPEEQELPVRWTETLGILSWKDGNSSKVKEEVRGRGEEQEGD